MLFMSLLSNSPSYLSLVSTSLVTVQSSTIKHAQSPGKPAIIPSSLHNSKMAYISRKSTSAPLKTNPPLPPLLLLVLRMKSLWIYGTADLVIWIMTSQQRYGNYGISQNNVLWEVQMSYLWKAKTWWTLLLATNLKTSPQSSPLMNIDYYHLMGINHLRMSLELRMSWELWTSLELRMSWELRMSLELRTSLEVWMSWELRTSLELRMSWELRTSLELRIANEPRT